MSRARAPQGEPLGTPARLDGLARRVPLGLALAALLLGAGCTDTVPLYGPPTQSTCPPGSTLTYDSFGKSFMERYCTRCHARSRTGDQRHGAPSFHDFDTLNGIKVVRDHIDETTAAGPAATNRGMPPEDPRPSVEDRKRLGEWIACDLP